MELRIEDDFAWFEAQLIHLESEVEFWFEGFGEAGESGE